MSGRHSKEYMREYQRQWLRKRRDEWINANGPCSVCGSTEDLQVDHIDRSTKEINPSHIWSRSEDVRNAELAKCQVLCKLCHYRKTGFELSVFECGRAAQYRRGCRCLKCKAWKRKHS